jgi:hypothetical protein
MKRQFDASGLFAGLLLIAIGSLFLLDRLGYGDFHVIVHEYWPMILVLLGITRLFNGRKPWGGIWLIVIGLWLQATTSHWYDLTFDTSWPLLVIAIGAVMVVRALLNAMSGQSEARDDR